MPRATKSSTRCSRWNCSSSASSVSTRPRRSSERRRRRSFLYQRMTTSCRLHDHRDGGRQALPLGGFGFQRLPSVGGEPVVLGAAIVLAHVPLGVDPALLFALVERGIQRALADAQLLAGHLPDALRDRPAVHRLERQHAKDQQVERPLHEIGWLAHRRAPVVSGFSRTREAKHARSPQRAQGPSFAANRDIRFSYQLLTGAYTNSGPAEAGHYRCTFESARAGHYRRVRAQAGGSRSGRCPRPDHRITATEQAAVVPGAYVTTAVVSGFSRTVIRTLVSARRKPDTTRTMWRRWFALGFASVLTVSGLRAAGPVTF